MIHQNAFLSGFPTEQDLVTEITKQFDAVPRCANVYLGMDSTVAIARKALSKDSKHRSHLDA